MIECDVWLIIDKNVQNQKKLSFREIKCKFFDYRSINQYRFYNSIFRRVVIAKNVVFDESSMIDRNIKIHHWNDDYECFISKNFVISEDNKKFNDFSSFDHNFDQFENFIQQITMLKIQIKRLFKFVAEKSNDS